MSTGSGYFQTGSVTVLAIHFGPTSNGDVRLSHLYLSRRISAPSVIDTPNKERKHDSCVETINLNHRVRRSVLYASRHHTPKAQITQQQVGRSASGCLLLTQVRGRATNTDVYGVQYTQVSSDHRPSLHCPSAESPSGAGGRQLGSPFIEASRLPPSQVQSSPASVVSLTACKHRKSRTLRDGDAFSTDRHCVTYSHTL